MTIVGLSPSSDDDSKSRGRLSEQTAGKESSSDSSMPSSEREEVRRRTFTIDPCPKNGQDDDDPGKTRALTGPRWSNSFQSGPTVRTIGDRTPTNSPTLCRNSGTVTHRWAKYCWSRRSPSGKVRIIRKGGSIGGLTPEPWRTLMHAKYRVLVQEWTRGTRPDPGRNLTVTCQNDPSRPSQG
jgi:hypothetical protein